MTHRNPRPFSWAELEWMEYCAGHGIPVSRCAAAMGRDIYTVMRRGKRMGLKFRRASRGGARGRDGLVRSERARQAAIARWARRKTVAGTVPPGLRYDAVVGAPGAD